MLFPASRTLPRYTLLSPRLFLAPLLSAAAIPMQVARSISPAPALPSWKEIPILAPSLFPAKSFSRAAALPAASPLSGFAMAWFGVKAIQIPRVTFSLSWDATPWIATPARPILTAWSVTEMRACLLPAEATSGMTIANCALPAGLYLHHGAHAGLCGRYTG